jgi:ATP-dependent helicase YprA (DUF1998 family)/very-short-patch-repair endonuclease
MNVFDLRERLVSDYANYISSFIEIKEKRIRDYVDESLKAGLLWPDPLIQLNPSFEPGKSIDELVQEGILNQECSKIFRVDKDIDPTGKPLRLHKHQEEAIRVAKTGGNYVLTTGTGSGKSLAFIVPIVDHILRCGSGNGIQAIIVYPMNALANSQLGELHKFIDFGYPKQKGPVTFCRYTGQESINEKNEIIANPPDIILTNYVMLELILTRPWDKKLVRAAKDFRFLVLDELHTYRGRQGADVAMLVRRVREATHASQLQCVGTSATVAGIGTYEEQQKQVAEIAATIFGDEVKPENVIGETLSRSTAHKDLNAPDFLEDLRLRVSDENRKPSDKYQELVNDPLSIWLESIFGLTKDKTGRLIRSQPKAIVGETGAAKMLSKVADIPEDQAIKVIEKGLLASYHCSPNPETGFQPFAFRLHQFISRGDNVYASIQSEESRHITVYGQQYVPGDRDKLLFPLVFCRECGQEYYSVRQLEPTSGIFVYEARDPLGRDRDEESEAGYLYLNTERPWPDDSQEVLNRIPDDWVEEYQGRLTIISNRKQYLPRIRRVKPNGTEAQLETEGIQCAYVASPFRFCLNCGVSYDFRQKTDYGKVSSVGVGGRSSATTILALSAIRTLKSEDMDLPQKARKLLSFTDNRQDASLQAGHFNDFIQIGVLRAGLYKAAKYAGENGISHDELTQKIFNALNLTLYLYASDPAVKFQAKINTDKAFRNVLGYRIYRDLKRGWRVTSPNLEQCGLLEIKYGSLKELCEAHNEWEALHPALKTASPETRFKIAKVLLDFMRRELAINVNYLDPNFQEQIQQQNNQSLSGQLALDEDESLEHAKILFPRSQRKGDFRGCIYLSPRSGYGQFLGRINTFPNFPNKLKVGDKEQIIRELLNVLKIAGIVKEVMEAKDKDDVAGYRLAASALLWTGGDGTQPFHDEIRVPTLPEGGGRTNRFFVDFYRYIAGELIGVEAREHTAQVPYKTREDREKRFREGDLPILFCSPTMELGVDISLLNVVNLRNVPPTPANYAQRGGRAGRSGQPALVFTYCAGGSPHDQFFFKRPEQMVMGSVTPPRLDLSNEDLIAAHVQAIWLAETGQDLGKSLSDILDLPGDPPSLELKDSVKDYLIAGQPKDRSKDRASRVLKSIAPILDQTEWYSEDWVDRIITQTFQSFDRACERWRNLYRAARAQRDLQHAIIGDASRSPQDKEKAKRLRAEAESQVDLLTRGEDIIQSDFYSYRYFASEGFLPGYSFPRLPLSAFIPGRIRKKGKNDFLSRPRFVAISEFGPRAFIYHEGSRYIINKVILPISDEERDLTTSQAKQCEECGYIHPVSNGNGPDLCESCGAALGFPFQQLFRLQNVSTKRRDRINCDEEERLRLGYEIRTGLRFAEPHGKPSCSTGEIVNSDNKIADICYGHAATIWRINLGWVRRKNKNDYGFVLDIENGYWHRNPQAIEDDRDDPYSRVSMKVIPYVEDRKNCLIIDLNKKLNENGMASIQAALKNAIQVVYQLEDNELAAEPLPHRDRRNRILFFEAAEGGAGVLRHLLDDNDAIRKVARQALELCHIDPDSGDDLKRAPRANEDCEAACYDCLMSYVNQQDHKLLDRKSIRDLLIALRDSQVIASPTKLSREKHLKRLINLSDSQLERDWLKLINENNLKLPSHANKFMEKFGTKPDFLYEEYSTVIYVDGPPHDYPDRQERDKEKSEELANAGFLVLRFHHLDDWLSIIKRYPNIFGKLS